MAKENKQIPQNENGNGDQDKENDENDINNDDSDDAFELIIEMNKKKKKKTLLELRCRVEDAILGNYLLGKPSQDLSKSESKKLKELLREITLWGVPLLPSKGHEGTNIVLLKFLRAKDFKVDAAFQMLRRTLKWRKENKADEILNETLSPDVEKVLRLNCRDREGRPLCYSVYGALRDEEVCKRAFGSEHNGGGEFLRWRIQYMEMGIKNLEFKNGGVNSIVYISDYKNFPGSVMKELRSVIRKALILMQDNYPELVHKIIIINAPLWYYAAYTLRSRFLTQKTKRKFVFVRNTKVTETLLKFIAAENLPVQYGGLKRENDEDFSPLDKASELKIRVNSTAYIEFPVSEAGMTMVWDLSVIGWDVSYKEEFIPDDEGSYKILIRNQKRKEESVRNSFYINEPGKILITIKNGTLKKKRVVYRSKAKPTVPMYIVWKNQYGYLGNSPPLRRPRRAQEEGLFQSSLALSGPGSRSEEYYSRRQNVCHFDRLQALEPDNRIQAEAGLIESWNPNHDQFQCAGVAVVRHTIEPNGLHLPSYTNTPQLIYIVRGRGILGTVFPGCAETFEESQRGQGRSSRPEDRHQKLRHFREGDVLAIPAGVAYWTYNNGRQQLVSVTLLDTSNVENQLDQNPRRFYLAGNPEDEFEQQEQQYQEQQGRESSRRRRGSENKRNIFRGLNTRFIEEAFKVDSETARRVQGENDNRNNIIKVKGVLDLVSPMTRSSQERQREERWEEEREREERYEEERGREQEEERERERRMRRGDYDNGLEETFCSMRLKENIGDPSRADVFTPQAGRISTVNSFNLPILRHLRLSAERGVLYNNGIYTPHWNLNAHSIMYVLRGRARIQVVDHFGQTFFDGEVRQGQILTLPQHHAVVKQAGSEGFEWVSFKTNDNAWISPLAGRTSVIRALPEAVLMNAFQISRDQAQRLKYNREETLLLSSSRSSERRAVA